MKKIPALSFILGLLFFARAHAVVINVDADALKTSSGSLMPETGLVILVASTQDSTFGGPSSGSFVSGDDIELFRWNLSTFATDGVLSDSTSLLSFSGNWNAGDFLQIYWFPTLTLSSLSPGAGTSYGTFRDTATLIGNLPDGGDLWVTPEESATINLRFLTTDGVFGAGSYPASMGEADFTVVPEPTSLSLLGTGIVGLLLRRRKRA